MLAFDPVLSLQRNTDELAVIANGLPDLIGAKVRTFVTTLAGIENSKLCKLTTQRADMTRVVLIANLLLHILRLHDLDTFTHSERVAISVERLSRAARLDNMRCLKAHFIGLFHDIGKLGVPGDTLRAKGPLNEDQWKAIRRHPIVGEELLATLLPQLCDAEVLAAVRGHHERWDGGPKSYPDGLKGEAICPLARIVSVADEFDAMVHSRSYRLRPRRQSDALEILKSECNKQFQGELVLLWVGLNHNV